MSPVQPVSPLCADVFDWKTVASIPSNVVGANLATDNLQVENDSYFFLMAFLASTNYDNAAGDFIAVTGAGPAATLQLIAPPRVANNFEVMIKYNGDQQLMGSPMPQGCLTANGYLSGRQLPYGMLFPPMTTFDFEFYNVAQTIQTAANGSTVKPLEISFGLYGYYIPTVNLEKFLAAWPAYYNEYCKGQAGWLSAFTALNIPGLT